MSGERLRGRRTRGTLGVLAAKGGRTQKLLARKLSAALEERRTGKVPGRKLSAAVKGSDGVMTSSGLGGAKCFLEVGLRRCEPGVTVWEDGGSLSTHGSMPDLCLPSDPEDYTGLWDVPDTDSEGEA